MNREPSLAKKVGWSAVATAFALVFLEGLASLYVAARDAPAPAVDRFAGERALCLHDDELGWRLAPDLRVEDYFRDGGTLVTTSRGHRGLEEVAVALPERRYRIVFLGDSFTMGYGVSDDETFPHQVTEFVPRVQSVNQGVSGYGLDQIYLAYVRDGAALEADLVLCCLIEEDLRRMLSDRFADRYAKPRLEVIERQLFVRNVPVPDQDAPSNLALRASAFVHELGLARMLPERVARASSGPARAGARDWQTPAEFVLRDLAARCRDAGRKFAVVLLPTHRDAKTGGSAASRWFARLAERSRIPIVDLGPDFVRLDHVERNRLYRLKEGDGHYTPEGNGRVARLLLEHLPAVVPRFLEGRRRQG